MLFFQVDAHGQPTYSHRLGLLIPRARDAWLPSIGPYGTENPPAPIRKRFLRFQYLGNDAFFGAKRGSGER
jgi:hypothetical protein